MPTYEYRCKDCGFLFEEFQSMKDNPIEACPKCDGKVQRLISAGAGMIFKGSGFYLTDYKKSSASPSNASGGTKTSPSTETSVKPETAPKTKTEKPAKAEKEPK